MKAISVITLLLLLSCLQEPYVRVPFSQYSSACQIYDLDQQSYAPGIDIYFRVQPIVFDSVVIDVQQLEEIINNMYSPGGLYFQVQDPIYADISEDPISYLSYLDNYYKAGEIRCLVMPEGISFYEERMNPIMGAADGIPVIDNPSKAKPTFFIRHEALYSDIVNHELGHVLGLFHTFKDNDLDNKGHNCDTGDKIPSTTTPFPGGYIVLSTCEFELPENAPKHYSDADKKNMVENTMSYSPDICMESLANDQFQRIRKIIEVNSRLQDCIIRTEIKVNIKPEAASR